MSTSEAMALKVVSARSRRKILAIGEGADPQRVAIGRQHRDAFAHVLGGRAAHLNTEARLQLPGALARGDDERTAAQPRHARLKRGQGPQRGIEKQQAEDLAGERLRLRMLLQATGKIQQRDDFVALAGRRGRGSASCRQIRQRVPQHVDVLLLEDERRQQPQDVGVAGGAGQDAALEQLRLDLLRRPRGAQTGQETRALVAGDRAHDAVSRI